MGDAQSLQPERGGTLGRREDTHGTTGGHPAGRLRGAACCGELQTVPNTHGAKSACSYKL
jgi:hypothetical protein